MNNLSFIEYVGGVGGIAGIMAILIFFSYRYLVNQMREDRKFMEDRLSSIIKAYNDSCDKHQEAIVKNTQVLTELITWLKMRNGIRHGQ